MTGEPLQPYSNTREDGVFRFLGVPTVMRSTAENTRGAFGMLEHLAAPSGFSTPYHTHRREDEAFYVMDGEVAFVCDGQWLKAGPGTYVYGPRDIPHGFQVLGQADARMLVLCAPGGGFERFVLEQATPIEDAPGEPDIPRLLALAEKYGIEIHGPLPEMPEGFAAGG